MRGYPKYFATKQDYLNVLEIPAYRERCLAELRAILDLKDDSLLVATTPTDPDDPSSEWNTETISNPNPLWKQKGFSARNEVRRLVDLYSSGGR
jgi:hypothetical protein